MDVSGTHSVWDWQTTPHPAILTPCPNPFPPFIFIWSFPPKTAVRFCVTKPPARRSIRISAVFPNNSIARLSSSVEWVKELKRVSNLWLKERGRDYADFEWQGGYADFSVSQSNLEQVKQYIAGQEEHHRKIPFQDELRALLRKHEIEWDEKYVWD